MTWKIFKGEQNGQGSHLSTYFFHTHLEEVEKKDKKSKNSTMYRNVFCFVFSSGTDVSCS